MVSNISSTSPMLRAVLRAARAASSTSPCNRHVAPSALASATTERLATRNQLRFAAVRGLSTTASKAASDSVPYQPKGLEVDGARVGELVEMIEQSRTDEDATLELEKSLELYEVLKQRHEQDSDLFEVAFGIARIYDEQLEDGATATTYYEEALSILASISTKVTVWGACMRVTTLGALAVCHETLGQSEEAEKYFDDAIGAYEEHCDQASDASEDVSNADVSLLAELNATVAMIHYHYAGNLLAQGRWEEAKNVTKITLALAENSSMPKEDLEELQHCIHELWLEMD